MSNLTQITDKLFALPVEKEYSDFYISGLGFICAYKPNRTVLCNEEIDIELASSLSILGTVDLESIGFDSEDGYLADFYKDYTTDNVEFLEPESSFRSLLKSKGIEPTSESKILIIEKV